jgi:cell division protein FtsQ
MAKASDSERNRKDDPIPLPGELDGDDESPYRRRTREVVVRRGRVPRRFGRVLKWTALTMLAAAPLVFTGYELAAYAWTSPRFTVSAPGDVVLVGNRTVTRDDILSALGIGTEGGPAGRNVLRLSLDEERREIESLPWVRSATLARSFPNRLRVQIVERVPIAFLNAGGRVKLVDEEGVVLDKPEGASFAFPVLEGLDAASNHADERARLALFQTFMREVGDDAYASGWLISEVNLADPDDVMAVLVEGLETIQVHFGHQNFAERLGNFLRLLPEVKKTHANVDSVDLRYRGQIVVNPATAAARPEKAAPAQDGTEGNP